MQNRLCCAVVALAGALAGRADAQAPAQDACFYSRDYQGFRAIDDHSFYIRVRLHDIYRIELDGACPVLTEPDARLITVERSGGRICGPLDWELRVATPSPGVSSGCIVTRQSRLTPAEADAIPRAQRP